MSISSEFKNRSYPYDISLILRLEKIITGANCHKVRGELQSYMSIITKLGKKRFNKNHTKQELIVEKNKCEEKLRKILFIYEN